MQRELELFTIFFVHYSGCSSHFSEGHWSVCSFLYLSSQGCQTQPWFGPMRAHLTWVVLSHSLSHMCSHWSIGKQLNDEHALNHKNPGVIHKRTDIQAHLDLFGWLCNTEVATKHTCSLTVLDLIPPCREWKNVRTLPLGSVRIQY